MGPLVSKEFVQMRSYLLQIVGFLALALVALGRAQPDMALSFFNVFPVVMAMTLPQLSFTHEERGNSFAFLRALPMRPWEIVAAKYLVSFLVTLCFGLLLLLAAKLTGTPRSATLMADLTVVLLISFLVAAASYFLHFWLGLKAARVALLVLVGAVAVVFMLVVVPHPSTVTALLSSPAGVKLTALATSPLGPVLSVVLGAMLLFASFAASARVFAARDLSRLP